MAESWKSRSPPRRASASYPFPFLPVALLDLHELARGQREGRDGEAEPLQDAFARRCAEAFQVLGFEVTRVNAWEAGHGPIPDAVLAAPSYLAALARSCRYALLLDPQARTGGYEPLLNGPDLLERLGWFLRILQQQGFERVYLTLSGPSFRETDLAALVPSRQPSGLAGITLLTPAALMRLVSESVRDRPTLSLTEFEEALSGNRIVRS